MLSGPETLALEVAYDQVRCHAGQAVRRQKRMYDKRAVKRVFTIGDWTMRYYPPAKKCKLDSPWLGPYLVVSTPVGQLVFSTTGLAGDFGSLPGLEDNSPASWAGVMATI